MKKIYMLIELTQEGELVDVIMTSMNKSTLRELVNKQNMVGSWDSSYSNFKVQYANSYCIYSRYIM
jgi:hypothetical protein